MKDLIAKLEVVKDEKYFLAFFRALRKDRETNAGSWGSEKIEDYLEASVAWAEDFKDIQGYSVSDNPWKRVADILYCGRTYH